MNNYRISKYNPIYRQDGIYKKEEWTSMGDIGRIYDNIMFTPEMYLTVEQSYLSVIKSFCEQLNVDFLTVIGLEDYNCLCGFYNGQEVRLNDILQISRDCLREKYWCKLESKDSFIHFGYDYYLYVGSSMTYENVKKITDCYNLYIEPIPSPYL